MKSNKGLHGRTGVSEAEDLLKKPVKLDPMRKSGKEKMSYKYGIEDDDEDMDLMSYKKRESVLDYFDDEAEED